MLLAYLATAAAGILAAQSAALYAFRDRAHATIRALLPEPSASLLAGILLGDDAGIPRDLEEAFHATSTLHIIAISGRIIAIDSTILR